MGEEGEGRALRRAIQYTKMYRRQTPKEAPWPLSQADPRVGSEAQAALGPRLESWWEAKRGGTSRAWRGARPGPQSCLGPGNVLPVSGPGEGLMLWPAGAGGLAGSAGDQWGGRRRSASPPRPSTSPLNW